MAARGSPAGGLVHRADVLRQRRVRKQQRASEKFFNAPSAIYRINTGAGERPIVRRTRDFMSIMDVIAADSAADRLTQHIIAALRVRLLRGPTPRLAGNMVSLVSAFFRFLRLITVRPASFSQVDTWRRFLGRESMLYQKMLAILNESMESSPGLGFRDKYDRMTFTSAVFYSILQRPKIQFMNLCWRLHDLAFGRDIAIQFRPLQSSDVISGKLGIIQIGDLLFPSMKLETAISLESPEFFKACYNDRGDLIFGKRCSRAEVENHVKVALWVPTTATISTIIVNCRGVVVGYLMACISGEQLQGKLLDDRQLPALSLPGFLTSCTPRQALIAIGKCAHRFIELLLRGYLHGDLHPNNVFIGADCNPVLIDFETLVPDVTIVTDIALEQELSFLKDIFERLLDKIDSPPPTLSAKLNLDTWLADTRRDRYPQCLISLRRFAITRGRLSLPLIYIKITNGEGCIHHQVP
eukprot:m.475795 g.475795  ORF g.475795 m.475795 type:complete len:468 (-) comp39138_c0_seq1:176-1579(-)